MANIAIKNRTAQSLLSMVIGMLVVAGIAVSVSVVPGIMGKSVGRATAETANQTLGNMLWHMASLPEICGQLSGQPVPTIGSPVSIPMMQFGQLQMTPGMDFLGISLTAIRLERVDTPATPLPGNRAVIKVIINSQKIGSTEIYSSEILIPILKNSSGTQIDQCIVPSAAGGGGLPPTPITMQEACVDMGGIWRDQNTNAVVKACDPSDPDFDAGIGANCPLDGLGTPFPFDVVLPPGLYHQELNPSAGACDYVAGLCKALGARISRIVKWDETVLGFPPFPSTGSGLPYGVGDSAITTVRVIDPPPATPPFVTPDPLCNPTIDPVNCRWAGGEFVAAEQMAGFATMCSIADFNMSFFQHLASDGGCPAGSYVIGFNTDATIRCSGTTTGICSNPGTCLRPSLISGRCKWGAAYTRFTNGVADSVVCVDEPGAHENDIATDPLHPFCVADLPTVAENRCRP